MEEALVSHRVYLERMPRAEREAVYEFTASGSVAPELQQAFDATPGFSDTVSVYIYSHSNQVGKYRCPWFTLATRLEPREGRGRAPMVVRTRTGLCVESVSAAPWRKEVLLGPGTFAVKRGRNGRFAADYTPDLLEQARDTSF